MFNEEFTVNPSTFMTPFSLVRNAFFKLRLDKDQKIAQLKNELEQKEKDNRALYDKLIVLEKENRELREENKKLISNRKIILEPQREMIRLRNMNTIPKVRVIRSPQSILTTAKEEENILIDNKQNWIAKVSSKSIIRTSELIKVNAKLSKRIHVLENPLDHYKTMEFQKSKRLDRLST